MYNSSIVNEFVKTMSVSLERRSSKPSTDVWPSPYADITLANDINGSFILSILNKIYSSSASIEQVAKLFYRPSRIVYLMYLFSLAPQNEKEANERILLAEKMLNTISVLRCGDPFINNGNNLIYGINKTVSSVDLYPANDFSYLLKKIIACLSVINEYCFFAWMGVGREVHGTYENNSKYYVVRDFYDLCADYWKFTSLLPWKCVSIITEEHDRSDIKFDFNGRMYYGSGGTFDISAFSIIVDNKPYDISEESLRHMLETLLSAIKAARVEVSMLKGNELLLQFARMQLYSLKKVAHKLDVEIPEELPVEIQNQILSASGASTFSKVLGSLKHSFTQEERIDILKDFFDPGNIYKAGV